MDLNNVLSNYDLKNFVLQNPFLRFHFKGLYYLYDFDFSTLSEGTFAILFNSQGKEIGHWTVAFLNNNQIEYYDSCGESFNKKPLLLSKILSQYNIKSISFNTQLVNSYMCGYFVLFFIINRIIFLDKDYEDVLKLIFVKNTQINNQRVKLFFSI